MRIAICVNHFHPSIGGCETVVSKISEHLSSEHKIGIFTRRLNDRNLQIYKKYSVFEYSPGDALNFVRSVTNFKPDVVFVYSDVFDFTRYFLTTNTQYNIILALCGANWLYGNKNFINTLYRNVNIKKIICHSKYDRDYKICSNDKLLSKTEIIPNAVDLAEFDNNIITREELCLKHSIKKNYQNALWVLNVSNFFPGKGQNHIFEVLKRLKKEVFYIQLGHEIGFPIGASLEAKWKVASSKYAMPAKLIKNARRDHVISFFKNSNAFVFTSEKEVAPLVVLESMAAELPWVSTDVGNIKGLQGGFCINTLKDQRYYSRFDERTYNLLSDKLEYILDNQSVGQSGRLQIEQEMTWEKVLPKYSNLFET